ncbi:MAG: site-specific integrase, partial [Bacteroides sp.]|nr:site-specific integrase [Bacteroides sp.]
MSIKLKFRPSSIEGREGSLYYQVIYRRIVRQVTTPYKVLSTEWDAENESLKHSNGSRSSYLVSIRQSIQWEMEHFQHIIRKTELSGKVFSADDIISTFQNQMQEIT